MEPWLMAVIATNLVFTGMTLTRQQRGWRRIANELDLPHGGWWRQQNILEGSIGGLPITVRPAPLSMAMRGSGGTLYEFGPAELPVTLEDVGTALGTLDDASQDSIALLSPEARETLLSWASRRGNSIHQGTIRVLDPLQIHETTPPGTESLDEVRELLQILRPPSHPEVVLAHNLLDPSESTAIRCRALRLLKRHDTFVPTLLAVLDQTSPPRSLLVTMLEHAPAELADAMHPLAQTLMAQHDRRDTVIRAASRLDLDLPTAALHAMMGSSVDEALLALGHLTVHPQPDTTSAMVELLEHTDHHVVLASIRALGASGELARVADLLPYTEGVFRTLELRQAARVAILKLQGDADDSLRGGLSTPALAASGALTEAHDPRGTLSPIPPTE